MVVLEYEKPEGVIQGFPEALVIELPREMGYADPDHKADGNDPERHLKFDFQSFDHGLRHRLSVRKLDSPDVLASPVPMGAARHLPVQLL